MFYRYKFDRILVHLLFCLFIFFTLHCTSQSQVGLQLSSNAGSLRAETVRCNSAVCAYLKVVAQLKLFNSQRVLYSIIYHVLQRVAYTYLSYQLMCTSVLRSTEHLNMNKIYRLQQACWPIVISYKYRQLACLKCLSCRLQLIRYKKF